MTGAFCEPVRFYLMLDLSHQVRDLTINDNKEVHIFVDNKIIQFDTANFQMKETMTLERSEGDRETKTIGTRTNLFSSEDGCNFHIKVSKYRALEYQKFDSSDQLVLVHVREGEELCWKRNASVIDTKIICEKVYDLKKIMRSLLTKQLEISQEKRGIFLHIVQIANSKFLVSAEHPKTCHIVTLPAYIVQSWTC